MDETDGDESLAMWGVQPADQTSKPRVLKFTQLHIVPHLHVQYGRTPFAS